MTTKGIGVNISYLDVSFIVISYYDIDKYMLKRSILEEYLPLTEATYYIMLTLVEPLHGYAVMQKVEKMSHGEVKMGPGTLYGVLNALESAELIVMIKEANRRKNYVLTQKGKDVLLSQINRLNTMYTNGLDVKAQLQLHAVSGMEGEHGKENNY